MASPCPISALARSLDRPSQIAAFTGAAHAGTFVPAASGVVTWLADDALLYQARADRQGRIRVRGGFSPANRARLLMRELVDLLTPDRLTRLSNALLDQSAVEAEQNARRARFEQHEPVS